MSDELTALSGLVVGLTLEDAVAILREAGFGTRVTQKDGQACIVTRDYKPDRINVAIEQGKVTALRGKG